MPALGPPSSRIALYELRARKIEQSSAADVWPAEVEEMKIILPADVVPTADQRFVSVSEAQTPSLTMEVDELT
jgi:Flp pilus assembly CpaE family ATPase